MKVRVDSAGAAEILRSDKVGAAIADLAFQVKDAVDVQGLVAHGPGDASGIAITADVRLDVTDRTRAVVAIRHPAGEAMQAKHGVLTRAAAAVGLEVKGTGR